MKRKKSMQPTPSPCSSPKLDVNLELDIKALRGKNKQLTQAVAKLQQDKKSQQDQITSLQEDYFDLNSKYVNLKNIFSNIDVATKVMFPKQLELNEMFGTIMRLCAVGVTVSNLNKEPITQSVKPHIVNGHVLQNPTITLSRLNNDSPSHTPPRLSGNRNNSPEASVNEQIRNHRNMSVNNDRSSTSSGLVIPNNHGQNSMREESSSGAESPPMVTRRRTTNSERHDVANTSGNESLEEEEEEDTSDPEYCSRLNTIQEEVEEQYSPTLSFSNKSQTRLSEVSGRVREIRIFLDPLSRDSIESNNIANHSTTRSYINCSVSEEPSTSAMDLSRKILNSSLGSPKDAMKFITSAIDSQSFSFSASSSIKPSEYSRRSLLSGTSRLDDSAKINRVRDARSKYRNLEEKPHKSEFEPTSNDSLSGSIPSVGELSNDDTSFYASSNDLMDVSKVETMKSLGLEPKNSLLMVTSTPVGNSPRSSLRIRKLNSSIENITRLSPRDSKVTKRRGGSNEKVVKVLLKRVSADKRQSGSPLKKVRSLLDTPPITKPTDLRRSSRSKETRNHCDNRQDTRLPELINATSELSSTTVNSKIRKNDTKAKKKGKENRQMESAIQTKSSPRPRRAVKPTQLKEPSLNKKMRRSR